MPRVSVLSDEEKKQRKREYMRKWRETNYEKVLAYQNEYMKQYYKDNEEYKEKQKKRKRIPLELQKKRGRKSVLGIVEKLAESRGGKTEN
jgi:hypothetical protein